MTEAPWRRVRNDGLVCRLHGEGPRMKAPTHEGESEAVARVCKKKVVREKSPLVLILLELYRQAVICKRSSMGEILHATTLTPIGPLQCGACHDGLERLANMILRSNQIHLKSYRIRFPPSTHLPQSHYVRKSYGHGNEVVSSYQQIEP